jgi:hypothetical protein
MLRHPKLPIVYFAIALASRVPNALPQHSQRIHLFHEQRCNKNRVEGLPHQAAWACVRVEYRYMERIMRYVIKVQRGCALFGGGGMQKQTLEI